MRTKQGRVLSTSNESDLNKANTMLDDASELIEGVIEQVTGTPVVEPADEGSDVNGGKSRRIIVDLETLHDVVRQLRIQGY